MIQRLSARPKTPSKQGILGQQGINLIEKIVIGKNSLWIPGGPNEVGVDGLKCSPFGSNFGGYILRNIANWG